MSEEDAPGRGKTGAKWTGGKATVNHLDGHAGFLLGEWR